MNKRYPTYKQSGVEWIGKIPAHWKLTRLKAATQYTINGVWGDEPKGDENDLICIRVADFDMGTLGVSKQKLTIRNVLPTQQRNRVLQIGDVLIEKSGGGDLQPVGRAIEYSLEESGVSSNFIGRIVTKPEVVVSRYLVYLLFTLYDRGVNTRNINQTTGIQNLDLEAYLNELGVFPSLAEQRSVALYLDRKTALIDEAIQKKQRLIELLQEERIVLINQAVTRGLNRDVKLKPSGVEWLGDVPEHWIITRLKFVASVRSGFALNNSNQKENTICLPYLRVANVQDGYLKLEDVATVNIEPTVVERYTLKAGDLLMNEGGDNDKLGRGCVWDGQINPCLHQNHVFAVRMKSDVNPYWIDALTLSTYARQYFLMRAKQTTNLASISQTNIKEWPVLMPPAKEQNEILDYIKKATTDIDKTVKKIRHEITLLQEYRTVLINEVVTGKRCVIHDIEPDELPFTVPVEKTPTDVTQLT